MILKNGTIYDGIHAQPFQGDLAVRDGKIAAVGGEISALPGEEVLDVSGRRIYPGLVDAHSHLGLDNYGMGFEGHDYNEMNDMLACQMRAIDSFNPQDKAVAMALGGGVTTVGTGPGSANVVGGTFLAIKLCGKRVDNMVVKNPVAMKIAFGENPKRCYGASQKKMPMTRMGTAALLRELLVKAENYREEMDAYEQDPKNNKKPTYDCKLHAMLPVMRKEIPLKSHAHRADDIFTSLRIAKEFDLDITLDHCTEGHLIADELAKEGKPCLVGPTFGAKSKFELKNKCWDTPKVMVEHGLKTCIITDAPVIPLKYLPLCAGLAINAGLDEQEAWKAVTINPAEVAGIGDRVGSLEVGKDADVVVYQGNPLTDLQYTTKYTVINGEIVYKAE